MDTATLLRKLEPLIPERVQHWHRLLDTADAEIRALLEKEIAHTAHQLLGDFHTKLLLSLPSEANAKGQFRLGTILYEKPRWQLALAHSELLQNLAIFGRSGAGKTNVMFHILEQLTKQQIPWLFLDWKRTARHLLPRIKGKVNVYTPGRSLSPFAFNPFMVPPGLEENVYVNLLVDVMAAAFTLGDGAKSVVQKALAACYDQGSHAPIPDDLLKEVHKLPDKERVRGWKISAERALQSLAFSDLTAKNEATQVDYAESLLQANTIVELDGLAQGGKQFLIPLLCLWLYYVKLAAPEREQLRFVIVVEEAHHVLYRNEQRAKETVMEMLLRQCREIGIGMIVVDQHPHLMSSAALNNTYTSICLNLKDPSDINRAAGLSLVPDADKHHLSMLPVGQGVVKLQDRWRRPVLVQFPLIEVAKGSVTDAVLSDVLRGSLTGSALRRRLSRKSRRVPRILGEDSPLGDEAMRFLDDVIAHPDDGVKSRYARLFLSTRKGHSLKEQLVRNGLLDDALITEGRTRKVVLRLSKTARDALGLDALEGRGSVAHEYWKRFYARRFEKQGYIVALEYRRVGGCVDVFASNGVERVGIEVETGKSDVVKNVRNCLLSKFDRVLVVATDGTALQMVEQQLAQARLIIRGRIEIVARDKGTSTLARA